MSSTSASTDLEKSARDRETARANLYHLLAKAFSLPREMEPEAPARLRSAVGCLDPALVEPALALSRAWKDALGDREALSLAYARLFLGPFEILAPPYASFYLEPDHRLMGEVSGEVAKAYEGAGLAPGSGPREAPDHVAVEWEYLYYLTYQYVESGDGRWIDERRRFTSTHCSRWMDPFARAIVQAGIHPFYSALAGLSTAALGELRSG